MYINRSLEGPRDNQAKDSSLAQQLHALWESAKCIYVIGRFSLIRLIVGDFVFNVDGAMVLRCLLLLQELWSISRSDVQDQESLERRKNDLSHIVLLLPEHERAFMVQNVELMRSFRIGQ